MRIKNLRRLRQRAEYHAAFDHVAQGTYGRANIDGKTEFEGCAIGCLATPTKLRKYLEGLGRIDDCYKSQGFSVPDYVTVGEVRMPSSMALCERLHGEFGFTYEFARLMEVMFEKQPTHGAAIDFIPKFAHRLRDDVEYDDRKIARMLNDLTEDNSYTRCWNDDYVLAKTEEVLDWLETDAFTPRVEAK